jgi:hypothetical protein
VKTRNKGYGDYGFESKQDAEELISYCRKKDFKFRCQLMIFAEISNPAIAADVCTTILHDISYKKLEKIKYIPICEKDFYAYRRMTLGKMREWMANMGIEYREVKDA